MKNWNLIRFILLILFIVAVLFLYNYRGFQNLLEPLTVQDLVSKTGLLAPFVFIILATIGIFLFFPGSLISITAGAVFPFWTAVTTVFAADVIGASLAFMFSRYLGRGFANDLLETKFKKLKGYDQALANNGFKTVLFLRLVPIFPFSGLNYTLALTKIHFRDYFLGTLLGIIPGNIIYVYLGNSIVHNQTRGIVIAISVILILIAVGYIIRKRNAKFPFIML